MVEIETCSFCDKPRREVVKLVVANGVSICDECLGVAASLIAPVVKIPGAALRKLLAKTCKLDDFGDQIVEAVRADEQALLVRLEQTEGELSRLKHFLDHWYDHFEGSITKETNPATLIHPNRTPGRCRAGSDGDCDWADCPQTRDGEPQKSGRPCPLLGEHDHE